GPCSRRCAGGIHSSARRWSPGRYHLAGKQGKGSRGEGRVEEVTDEPLYRDRVCGIDIGKAGLVATIRVPAEKDPARRAAETRSFGTTRREGLALAGWLRCWQGAAGGMGATGGCWEGGVDPLGGGGGGGVGGGARRGGGRGAGAAPAGPAEAGSG